MKTLINIVNLVKSNYLNAWLYLKLLLTLVIVKYLM